MKNIIIVLVFINTLAKSQITFNKTYHTGIDASFSCVETNDGYLTSSMSGFPIYPQHLNLIKINFYGDTLWTKQYGDSDEYIITYSLIPLSDATLIAGCFGYNYIQDNSFIYLFKLTYNGDTIWTKKIMAPTGYDFYGQYITLTSDKHLIISGEIADNMVTDGDGFILKADSNGNYLWHKTFGGGNFDSFYSSVELPDKGFLSLGWTRSFGFGNNNNRDVYLVKTDSLGNFKWQKTYGDSSFETDVGITACLDGNFLLAGVKELNNIGNAWLTKIDTGGSVIWQNTYNFGYETDLWWPRELPNSDIISVGSCRNATNQKDDGLIFCTDAHGYVKWHRTFPMNNNHAYFRDVLPTSDGGFICAGFAFVGASGNQDAWLIKLDSIGCDSAGCPTYYTAVDEPNLTSEKEKVVRCYPNPASNIIFITLLQNRNADVFEVSLFNTQGAQVLKRKMLNTKDAQPLFISALPKGLYLLRCEVDGMVYSSKVIKE